MKPWLDGVPKVYDMPASWCAASRLEVNSHASQSAASQLEVYSHSSWCVASQLEVYSHASQSTAIQIETYSCTMDLHFETVLVSWYPHHPIELSTSVKH